MAANNKAADAADNKTGADNVKPVDGKQGEEIAELKAKLAAAESRADAAEQSLEKSLSDLAAVTFTAEDRTLIEAKIAAGLDRDQAEEVVTRQKAHDLTLED